MKKAQKRFISNLEKKAEVQLKEKKMRKERRSRSRKRRKERNIELEESPEPKKKYCYSECKLEERNKRGKMIACGLLCNRHDEHEKRIANVRNTSE